MKPCGPIPNGERRDQLISALRERRCKTFQADIYRRERAPNVARARESRNSDGISAGFPRAAMNSLRPKVPELRVKADVESLNSHLKVTPTNPLF